jgi:hypothetical protein
MAGRRGAICFGIFLGTTRCRSRRQRSQVARQAALSIMANTVIAFNALRTHFLCEAAGCAYQYWYWYWYWYKYRYLVLVQVLVRVHGRAAFNTSINDRRVRGVWRLASVWCQSRCLSPMNAECP